MIVREVLRRMVAVSSITLLTSVLSDCPPKKDSSGLSVAEENAVKAQNWYEYYYESASRTTGANPPTFTEKYDAGALAPGMTDIVNAEYSRLRQALPPADSAKLDSWVLSVGICSVGSARLLTTIQPAAAPQSGGRMCVAAFLVTALFFEVASRSLLAFRDTLVASGQDPAAFTGIYGPGLTSKGITPADWRALLESHSGVYDLFVASIDIVLAQQIERVVASGAGTAADAIDGSAAILVRKATGVYNPSLLISTLRDAVSHASPTEWGYCSAGDGQDEVERLTASGRE